MGARNQVIAGDYEGYVVRVAFGEMAFNLLLDSAIISILINPISKVMN